MKTKFNFDEVAKKMMSLDISKAMGDILAKEFDRNFKEEGFDGKKWKEVNRRISGASFYKKDSGAKTRPILQGLTGKLRRAVRNSSKTGIKLSKLSYSIVVDNPYAGYNNYGSGKIPKRQFIGMSTRSNKVLLNFIKTKVDSIWVI